MNHPQRLDDTVHALVLKAQSGDSRAFEELVRRSHGQIHRWAMAHTGDPDDADDVVQNVFLRLSQSLGRFRGESRFSTWLYQLTRNVAIDQHRRRARRRRLESAADDTAATSVPGPASELEKSEELETVVAAYRALPDRQRTVFDLVDLQGYAPGEVAEMLEMKAVTVRAHLHKARRAVRTTILALDPDFRMGHSP